MKAILSFAGLNTKNLKTFLSNCLRRNSNPVPENGTHIYLQPENAEKDKPKLIIHKLFILVIMQLTRFNFWGR